MVKMTAIKVANLSYAYPNGSPALRGVSLEVARGETLGLLGPNGAGKSTLLLHLNGTLRGDGIVEILGERLTGKNLDQIRRQVGLVFEDPDDQLFMPTVFDDIAFGLLNLGQEEPVVRRLVQETLAAVGMAGYEAHVPHRLSLGQKKRVALATVLVIDCDILALDEPTGGLDPAGRENFIKLISAQPLTKVIATHDMELAWQLCDRVAIIDQGKVFAVGPANDILTDEQLLRAHQLRCPLGVDVLSHKSASGRHPLQMGPAQEYLGRGS